MAKQSKATDATVETFGPFGDKLTHGTELLTDTAREKVKDDDGKVTGTKEWKFTYYAPKDAAELVKLVQGNPDIYLLLARTALKTGARSDSWFQARGGSVNVWARVNGAPPQKMPAALVPTMRSHGMRIDVVPNPEKKSKK